MLTPVDLAQQYMHQAIEVDPTPLADLEQDAELKSALQEKMTP